MNSETTTAAVQDHAVLRERLKDVALLDSAVAVVVDRTPDGDPLSRLAVPVGGARRSGSLRCARWPQAISALWELEGHPAFPRVRIHQPCRCARAGAHPVVKWGEDLPFDDPVACGRLYGYTDAAALLYAQEQAGRPT